jgi:hypothetical protein
VRVAALVLGILGTLLSLVPLMFWLGVPLGIVAAVLAVLARNRDMAASRSTGLSTAGLVLGTLGIVIGVCMYGARVALLHAANGAAQHLEDPRVSDEARKASQEFKDAFDHAVPNR